ncbi:MAG: AraC family transcriptional regulator [Simkaniaceae bacterium]|nr:AraC family transcriptional regulator [Simkaniaceae bacterium]
MEEFNVIGIAVKTSNEEGKAEVDILGLWNKFLSENIFEKIPNVASHEIYSVYTDYEGDYTAPYTVILGCKVETLDSIPEGMVGKKIPASKYDKHLAKGNLEEGVVFEAWQEIWKSQKNRTYTADFEVYGEKAKDPENAEVDIYIAVK